jgi:hypothetical protein
LGPGADICEETSPTPRDKNGRIRVSKRRDSSLSLADDQLRNTTGGVDTSLFEAYGNRSSTLFRPSDKGFFIWQAFLRFVALINVIVDSYLLAFVDVDVGIDDDWALYFVLCLDALYGIATLLRFSTSVIDLATSKEYYDRLNIIRFQLRTPSFYMDLLSELGAFGVLPDHRWMLCFHLLRAWRLAIRREQEGSSGDRTDELVQLLELVLGVWLLGHVFGCVWFSVIYDVQGGDVYGGKMGMEVYLLAFRDGLMILTESGHRVSHNNDGRIALVVLILRPSGAIFIAYVFAQLVVTLQRLTIMPTKQAEHMALIRAAMVSLALPRSLSQRIVKYHSYLCMHHNESAYSALFGGLSVNLSIELKLFLFRKLLREAPFFQELEPHIVHELVLCFKEAVHSPGDIIIRKGDIGKEMFFIVKGSVEVLGDNGSLLAEKTAGDYFGEVALVVKRTRRTAYVRAKTYCILAALTQTKLDEALVSNPAQLERMEERIRTFHNIPKEPSKDSVVSSDLPSPSRSPAVSPVPRENGGVTFDDGAGGDGRVQGETMVV